MFTSLSQFYNSKEWRSFRLQLISERTNKADGVLYCEHSGKPLLKSYDIVLHHKKQLTMANVNDYSVSLNPDNIMVVSQAAHNEIHARFGYQGARKVYLVYGAPCSGKTTFVNNIKGNSDIVVDMDNIWQCITGGEKYNKPAALKQNAFMVRDCMLDMIKTRTGKWERAFVISAAGSTAERERMCGRLGAELIHIDTPKERCIQNLLTNPQGRDIDKWTKYINEHFDSV